MGRKSSITRLEPAVRRYLEKVLREDRLTLSEITAELRKKFPTDTQPSRSAVHRYKGQFEAMMGRIREFDAAARVLVTEFGENADEKSGALLAQAVTTLATQAALKAHGDEQISVKDIGALARAARNAAETRKVTRRERREIADDARRQLLEEQERKLQTVVKSGGLTEEAANTWRRQILGIDG